MLLGDRLVFLLFLLTMSPALLFWISNLRGCRACAPPRSPLTSLGTVYRLRQLGHYLAWAHDHNNLVEII